MDGLRGLAALGIAQFHMYFLGCSSYPFQKQLQLGYSYGWLLVEFFMVLSGLLMQWNYAERLGSGKTTLRYFLKGRIARLYPAYFVTLLVCGGLTLVYYIGGFPVDMAGFFTTNTLERFILSLVGIHYVGLVDGYSFNYPAWFLGYLMVAYIAFFLVNEKLQKEKRALAYVGLIFTGLICMRIYYLFPACYIPLINLDMGRILISFFAGCLLGKGLKAWDLSSLKKESRIAITVFCWCALVLICVPLIKKLPNDAFVALTGDYRVVCALLLFPLFLFAVKNTRPLVWILERFLFRFLGKISYSILLWQFPILIVLRALITKGMLPFESSSLWLIIVYFGPLLFISVISCYLIEVKGKRYLMESNLFEKDK